MERHTDSIARKKTSEERERTYLKRMPILITGWCRGTSFILGVPEEEKKALVSITRVLWKDFPSRGNRGTWIWHDEQTAKLLIAAHRKLVRAERSHRGQLSRPSALDLQKSVCPQMLIFSFSLRILIFHSLQPSSLTSLSIFPHPFRFQFDEVMEKWLIHQAKIPCTIHLQQVSWFPGVTRGEDLRYKPWPLWPRCA